MIGSRNHSFEIVAIAVFGLIALVACSPSTSADDGTFTPTIASALPEGVTITIPFDALPDGVSADEIEVTVLEIELPEEANADHPGPPELALAFTPDGLQLEAPLTVSVPIEADRPGTIWALHQSGDTIESPPVELTDTDGERRAEIEIDHFSTLTFRSAGNQSLFSSFAGTAAIEVVPTSYAVLLGQELLVDLTMTAADAGPVASTGKVWVSKVDTPANHPDAAAPSGANPGALTPTDVEVEVSVPAGRKHTFNIQDLIAGGPVSPERHQWKQGLALESGANWFPEDSVAFTCERVGDVYLTFSTLGFVTAVATVTKALDPRLIGLDLNILVYYPIRREAFEPDATCVATVATPWPTPTPVTDRLISVPTLVIGGQHYPIEQFSSALPDACELTHWHASGPVFSLEGTRDDPSGATAIKDEDPDKCGFGAIADVPQITLEVSATAFGLYREVLASN